MTAIPASDRVVTASDNQPPDPLAPVKARVDALIKNTNLWLKTTERQAAGEPVRREIATVEEATKLEDAFVQLRKMFGDTGTLEKDRKAINKPHKDAIAANDSAFRPLMTAGQAMLTLLGGLRTGWLKKEQERLAAEALAASRKAEEERQRAEDARRAAEAANTVEEIIIAAEAEETAAEATAVADAALAAKPQVRGEHTTRAASLRTFYSAEITDYAKALSHYAGESKVRDVVQELANRDARSEKDALNVPGVKLKTRQEGV